MNTQPIHQKWDEAVADFQQQVPDLGRGLKQIIDAEHKANPGFVAAFADSAALCRASLNPNLRDEAVEEMFIQHLLTERLFRTVFKNPDFVRRNAIARQIEIVLDALFSRSYSRDEYLGSPLPLVPRRQSRRAGHSQRQLDGELPAVVLPPNLSGRLWAEQVGSFCALNAGKIPRLRARFCLLPRRTGAINSVREVERLHEPLTPFSFSQRPARGKQFSKPA